MAVRQRGSVRSLMRRLSSVPRSQGLLTYLEDRVSSTGPINLAAYMDACLTHPQYGYYTTKADIGAFGDYTTGPEATPMFGTLLSKWCQWVYEGLGEPGKVNLVELGPGTGVNAKSILGALPDDMKRNLSLHLVEISPIMRRTQQDSLGVSSLSSVTDGGVTGEQNAEFKLPEFLRQPFQGGDVTVSLDESLEISKFWREGVPEKGGMERGVQEGTGLTITWHTHVTTLPEGPLILIANEFFDALPTHQFKYHTETQTWSQSAVDYCPDGLALTQIPTPPPSIRVSGLEPNSLANGEGFEICPEAQLVSIELAKKISRFGGGALIIDYGDFQTQVGGSKGRENGTIRSLSRKASAIQGSGFSRPLCVTHSPGDVDMTSDVHFGAISEIFSKTPQVELLPFQPQAYLFTELMGDRIYHFRDIIKAGYHEGMSKEEEDIYHMAPLVDIKGVGGEFKCICALSEGLNKGSQESTANPGLPLGWNMKEMVEAMERMMRTGQGMGTGTMPSS
ncbi:hypothetical protein AAMO2058_001121200 [Amorphochlora amoebiformis]